MLKSSRQLTLIPTSTFTPTLRRNVLLPLQGKPLFLRTVERVQQADLAGPPVVVTTCDPDDDPIAHICWQEKLPYIRGDASDLPDRLYRAGSRYGAKEVVIVRGDSALIDPAVIDRVVAAFQDRSGKIDYASNMHPRSLPQGNDVQVMSMEVLEAIWRHAWQAERDALEPGLMAEAGRFRTHNVCWPELPPSLAG